MLRGAKSGQDNLRSSAGQNSSSRRAEPGKVPSWGKTRVMASPEKKPPPSPDPLPTPNKSGRKRRE